MAFRGIVGKIEDEYEKVHLYWKIENFFSLVQTVDNRYHSPAFDCYGESFFLEIYPNGEKGNKGWIALYLVLRERCPSLEIQFQFAIKTANGDLKNGISLQSKFGSKGKGYGSPKFLERTILLRQRDLWVPFGDLTIAVTLETGPLQMEKRTNDVYVQTDFDYFQNLNTKEERQQVKAVTCNKSVQAHFENSTSGETNDVHPEKAVTFNKSVQAHLENSICGETNNVYPEKGSQKVVQDITKAWRSGDNSDVVVRVKDKEFKAHKVVLAARSPVLFAMFQHDTAESRSGEIKISDCEPDVFQEYLHYIYSGSPQELTSRNAAALYTVAEKYLADDLKDQCLKHIRNNLSIDTFCEGVMLALNYGESELLKHATDFASENIRQIVKSVEWQRFIQDEPTTANEILIKALGS